MEKLSNLAGADIYKVLGDQRRVDILRWLMTAPATLSQLGVRLDLHPAKVRYHLLKLEQAGLVSLTSTRVVRGFVEKYYQASAQAYLINQAILPQAEEEGALIATGSHDLALELLAATLREKRIKVPLYTLPLGSLDGLIALRQGIGHLAGIHLYDNATNEYNRPYVRYFFPDQQVRLFTLADRQQGLIVAEGNPHNLQNIPDLAQPGIKIINRKRGSGTRLWLDQQLEQAGINRETLDGYDTEAATHTQVAEAVAQGRADAGIGLLAAALKYKLGFVPLFEERYDLAIPEEQAPNPLLMPVLDYLNSAEFKQKAANLGGYSTHHSGEELAKD